jgi:uncharacterized protein (TIGR02118 family)
MIRISVLYPNTSPNFDLDYYLGTHIPLVHKLLDPFGLVRTEVDKGIGSAGPDTKAPYAIICHMVFDSPEKMQEGLKAHDPTLAADVPNFTDIQPKFQVSEIVK